MLRYNEEENIIECFQNDIEIPEVSIVSPDYDSFMSYIRTGVKQDIIDYWVPAMRDCLNLADKEYSYFFHDYKITEESPDFWGNKHFDVKGHFSNIFISKENTDFQRILQLPFMDRQGIIYKDGKRYSITKQIEQDKVVSWDAKRSTLKIVTRRGNISITHKSGRPIMTLSGFKNNGKNRNIDALIFMYALTENEYPNVLPEDLYDAYRNSFITRVYKKEKNKNQAIIFYGSDQQNTRNEEYPDRIVPESRKTTYQLDGVRPVLNGILSLDRAIGKKLAEPVISVRTGEKIYNIGTIVTEAVLRNLKYNYVTTIYVDNIPNVQGYYTAGIVDMPIIRRGTKVVPVVADILPNEAGNMYVSQHYDLRDENGKCPSVPIGTMLDKDTLEVLMYNGHTEVQVSDGSNQDVFTVYLSKEILSNRCFKASEIGVKKIGTSEWVYVDEDLNVMECPNVISVYDMHALLSLCSNLFYNQDLEVVVNADTSFRKRVVMVEDFYHRAFERACKSFFQKMGRKIRSLYNYKDGPYRAFQDEFTSDNFYPFTVAFWKSLRDDLKCVQILDTDAMTNPVSFASAMTKINTFIKDVNSISDEQRIIALGQYGKIDPYESPQSSKLGVVNNLAIGAKIEDGILKAPYYEVVPTDDGCYVNTQSIHYMSAEEEEQYCIGDIGSLKLDSNGKILNDNDYLLTRSADMTSLERQTISYHTPKSMDFVSAYPSEYLSWATSTVPFLGANDAARVVFGVSQAKQAKSLIHSEAPYIMTKANELIPKLNQEFCIFAEGDGEVFEVYNRIEGGVEVWDVEIAYDDNSLNDVPEGSETVEYDRLAGIPYIKQYEFTSSISTGLSYCVKRPVVKEGQRVKKGDLLVSSDFLDGKYLAMGVNALTAFIPNGFNYEDGIFVSTRLCDKMKSYRVNHDYETNPNKHRNMVVSKLSGKQWIKKGDKFLNYTFADSMVDYPVHSNRFSGFCLSYDTDVEVGKFGNKICKGIEYELMSIDPLKTGDKVANRHGNKGVVPAPRPTSEMPRLKNGIPFDMVCNPHGVGSRMNIGQVLECHAGLVCYVTKTRMMGECFNSISSKEIFELLDYTYELANMDDYDDILSRHPMVPKNFHKHCMQNIAFIKTFKDTFDRRGEAYVYNPHKGYKQSETKVLVGINYWYKLYQESDKKIHARGGVMNSEPYLSIYNSPTKGSSNHGGQKCGTMEIDALSAYGSSYFLQELFNERGDNGIARNNLTVQNYFSSESSLMINRFGKGQRRSTEQFLYTMLALGVMTECTENEFINISKGNQNMFSYTMLAYNTVSPEDVGEESEDNHETDDQIWNDDFLNSLN